MNQSESVALKEKLDALINAASDFGSQSQQLSKARGDFDEYLSAIKANTDELSKLIEKCEDYITSARAIVEKDFTTQVEALSTEAAQAVEKSQKMCQELSEEYDQVLKAFYNQKDVFDKQQNDLVEVVKDGFCKSDEIVSNAFDRVSDKVDSSLASSSSEIKELVTFVSDNIDISKKDVIDAANLNFSKLYTKTSNIDSSVLSLVEREKKDRIFLIISSAAASIAVILSIIGLFL